MGKKKVVLLSMYWSSDTKEMLGSKHYFRELQPWVQETINLFKNKNDVELHVVAPNFASNTDVDTQKDGIYFHFFNYAPKFLCSCVYLFFCSCLLLWHRTPKIIKPPDSTPASFINTGK